MGWRRKGRRCRERRRGWRRKRRRQQGRKHSLVHAQHHRAAQHPIPTQLAALVAARLTAEEGRAAHTKAHVPAAPARRKLRRDVLTQLLRPVLHPRRHSVRVDAVRWDEGAADQRRVRRRVVHTRRVVGGGLAVQRLLLGGAAHAKPVQHCIHAAAHHLGHIQAEHHRPHGRRPDWRQLEVKQQHVIHALAARRASAHADVHITAAAARPDVGLGVVAALAQPREAARLGVRCCQWLGRRRL